VNHSTGFREHTEGQRSGWHSNDVESEFSHFKRFVRVRFGVLQTRGWGLDCCGHLWEWQLRTNYPDLVPCLDAVCCGRGPCTVTRPSGHSIESVIVSHA